MSKQSTARNNFSYNRMHLLLETLLKDNFYNISVALEKRKDFAHLIPAANKKLFEATEQLYSLKEILEETLAAEANQGYLLNNSQTDPKREILEKINTFIEKSSLLHEPNKENAKNILSLIDLYKSITLQVEQEVEGIDTESLTRRLELQEDIIKISEKIIQREEEEIRGIETPIGEEDIGKLNAHLNILETSLSQQPISLKQALEMGIPNPPERSRAEQEKIQREEEREKKAHIFAELLESGTIEEKLTDLLNQTNAEIHRVNRGISSSFLSRAAYYMPNNEKRQLINKLEKKATSLEDAITELRELSDLTFESNNTAEPSRSKILAIVDKLSSCKYIDIDFDSSTIYTFKGVEEPSEPITTILRSNKLTPSDFHRKTDFGYEQEDQHSLEEIDLELSKWNEYSISARSKVTKELEALEPLETEHILPELINLQSFLRGKVHSLENQKSSYTKKIREINKEIRDLSREDPERERLNQQIFEQSENIKTIEEQERYYKEKLSSIEEEIMIERYENIFDSGFVELMLETEIEHLDNLDQLHDKILTSLETNKNFEVKKESLKALEKEFYSKNPEILALKEDIEELNKQLSDQNINTNKHQKRRLNSQLNRKLAKCKKLVLSSKNENEKNWREFIEDYKEKSIQKKLLAVKERIYSLRDKIEEDPPEHKQKQLRKQLKENLVKYVKLAEKFNIKIFFDENNQPKLCNLLGGKEGGVNASAPEGGRYLTCDMPSENLQESDLQKYLYKVMHPKVSVELDEAPQFSMGLTKQDAKKQKKDISEYLGSRLFSFASPGKGAEVTLVRTNNEGYKAGANTRDSDAEVYVSSEYMGQEENEHYDDLFVDMNHTLDEMHKEGRFPNLPQARWAINAGDDRPRMSGTRQRVFGTYSKIFKRNQYQDFHEIVATSLLMNNFDLHPGNIGVVTKKVIDEETGQEITEKRLVRIDFGGSHRNLTDEIHPHQYGIFTEHGVATGGASNHYNEFPEELKFSSEMSTALFNACDKINDKEGNITEEARANFYESFAKMQEFYSAELISDWAIKSLDSCKKVEGQDHLIEINGEIKYKQEISAIDDILPLFESSMCKQADLWREYASQIDLSLAAREAFEEVKNNNEIERQNENLKGAVKERLKEKLKEIIKDNPKYFQAIIDEEKQFKYRFNKSRDGRKWYEHSPKGEELREMIDEVMIEIKNEISLISAQEQKEIETEYQNLLDREETKVDNNEVMLEDGEAKSPYIKTTTEKDVDLRFSEEHEQPDISDLTEEDNLSIIEEPEQLNENEIQEKVNQLIDINWENTAEQEKKYSVIKISDDIEFQMEETISSQNKQLHRKVDIPAKIIDTNNNTVNLDFDIELSLNNADGQVTKGNDNDTKSIIFEYDNGELVGMKLSDKSTEIYSEGEVLYVREENGAKNILPIDKETFKNIIKHLSDKNIEPEIQLKEVLETASKIIETFKTKQPTSAPAPLHKLPDDNKRSR